MLAFFDVQVFCGGKIKRRIEIITSLTSPSVGLVPKMGLCEYWDMIFSCNPLHG